MNTSGAERMHGMIAAWNSHALYLLTMARRDSILSILTDERELQHGQHQNLPRKAFQII